MKITGAIKMLVSTVKLVKNPVGNLDEVIELADTIASPKVIQSFVEDAKRDPQAARAIAERPRIHIDLATLRALPEGTLGREFAEFMIANGLDPAALPTRPSGTEGEFIQAHLYETHDVWHVVTGFETDTAGELGLQAFYLAQLPARLAPVLLVAGLLNMMFYEWGDRDRRMSAIARGWQLGKQSRPLFGVRWDDHWAKPLAEVRATFAM